MDATRASNDLVISIVGCHHLAAPIQTHRLPRESMNQVAHAAARQIWDRGRQHRRSGPHSNVLFSGDQARASCHWRSSSRRILGPPSVMY